MKFSLSFKLLLLLILILVGYFVFQSWFGEDDDPGGTDDPPLSQEAQRWNNILEATEEAMDGLFRIEITTDGDVETMFRNANGTDRFYSSYIKATSAYTVHDNNTTAASMFNALANRAYLAAFLDAEYTYFTFVRNANSTYTYTLRPQFLPDDATSMVFVIDTSLRLSSFTANFTNKVVTGQLQYTGTVTMRRHNVPADVRIENGRLRWAHEIGVHWHNIYMYRAGQHVETVSHQIWNENGIDIRNMLFVTHNDYLNDPKKLATFEFRISADHTASRLESFRSAATSFTITSQLLQPGNIRFDNGVLRWNHVAGNDGYIIYALNNGEVMFQTGTLVNIAEFDLNHTVFPDLGTYTFEVFALNAVYNVLSSPAATISINKTQRVATPTNVRTNLNRSELEWNAVANATHYRLLDHQSGHGSGISAPNLSLPLYFTTHGTHVLHLYAMRFGYATSLPFVGTFHTTRQLDTPQNLAFNQNTMTFTWNTVSDADEFHIEIIINGTHGYGFTEPSNSANINLNGFPWNATAGDTIELRIRARADSYRLITSDRATITFTL